MKKFGASLLLVVINLLIAFFALKLSQMEWRGKEIVEWLDVFLLSLFSFSITVGIAFTALFLISKTVLSKAVFVRQQLSILTYYADLNNILCEINTDYVRLFHVWAPLFWSTPRYFGRVVESIHRLSREQMTFISEHW